MLATAAGLILGALFLLRPYIDRPALLQDPYAVSDALADVAVLSVAMDARGVDLLAAPELPTFRGIRPEQALCAASVLASEAYPPDACRVVRVVYADHCRNAKGCALLWVDPSVLREPALAAPLFRAFAEPCEVLARAAAQSPERLGRPLTGLHDTPSADISQLHCDRMSKFHPKSVGADRESGSIRINF